MTSTVRHIQSVIYVEPRPNYTHTLVCWMTGEAITGCNKEDLGPSGQGSIFIDLARFVVISSDYCHTYTHGGRHVQLALCAGGGVYVFVCVYAYT